MKHLKLFSKKDATEMRKIDRLQIVGKATRAQLLRGMDLHRQHDAASRAKQEVQNDFNG